MSNILIYTFRTYPRIEDIKNISKDIVVLDTLKEDILEVEKKLKQNKYAFVLGIAKGRGSSVFETKGVNKFNKGKILTDGKESYPLYFPKQGFENIKEEDIPVLRRYITSE